MRIAFICRGLVIKSLTSGISNALTGWATMLKQQGHKVDVITDIDNYHPYYNEIFGNVHYPDNALTYTKHNDVFQFKDGFNFERCLNFRTALIKALSNNIYDVLVCNEPESAFVAYQMQLNDIMKVVYYTHEPGTFFKDGTDHIYKFNYFDLIDRIFQMPFYSGFPTQTNIEDTENRTGKLSKSRLLPLPLTSLELLNDDVITWKNKDGVIINGRIEDRKNPEFFMKTLVGIREKYGKELKAKFLTKESHVKKAEALCKKYDYKNYEVHSNLLDPEKFDLIESARVGFYPAIQETYGLAAFESLRYHPTVFLKEYDWYKNFNGYSNQVVVEKKDAIDKIWQLHESSLYLNKAHKEFVSYDDICTKQWNSFINEKLVISYTKSPSNKLLEYLKTHPNTWVDLRDIFKAVNVKGTIYLSSDIESMYKSSDKFKVHQKDKNTYLAFGDKPEFMAVEEKEKENSFFEFQ